MPDLTLNDNQAAIVLEADEEGEISVQVVQSNGADSSSLPAELCQVIARKLIDDEQFRNIVIAGLEE